MEVVADAGEYMLQCLSLEIAQLVDYPDLWIMRIPLAYARRETVRAMKGSA
jgi:hypothetical protein